MLKKNKIFKNFYTFATFSLIGTSAIYAKDGSSIPNDTLIENQQKLKNRATMSTKVSNKIKNKLDSDLDLDFDFDEQRKSEDSIFKDIKDKAPYIAMATAPSLTVLSYGAIRKVFGKVKSKKLDDNNNNKKKNKNNNNNKKKKKKKKNKNNNNNNKKKKNKNNNNNNNNENEESSSALTILATVLVAIVFLLIIYDKCCGSSDNVPPKAKEVPIDIKRIPNQEEKGNQIQENKVKQFYGNSEELNKYKNRNSSPKGYIEDVYKKTGVGALAWENNNCFILSGIYTQICMSLKTMNEEIDGNINGTSCLPEEDKIDSFVSILEKRLQKRLKEEPSRYIWQQCLNDLKKLRKGDKGKLKRFVTCALNVILMNRLSWDGFMQVPNKQYEQENNLFGLKTTIKGNGLYDFRKNNDQGSPADALGGMGIRLTDVGATAFDYYIVKGRNEKIPVSPENNFPYRQVLDLTSEFVTMQYDKNEGFKIIDRTWSKGEGVTIKLGGNFDNGPISYENAAIAKLWTVNSTDGQNNYYDDEKSFIDENEKEQVEANAKKYLHELESSRELVGKGKIVEMYEYVINEDIYGKERRFGTEALCKDALEKKRNLNGKETYEKKLKNFTIEYNEKVDNIIPEDFQKKRMYIGAIGYVKGGAAGNGGHCQTLEPKYKWNDKKGYYEIVCWIDRGCLGGAGKVISNDEALSILKKYLGKYNGNKDNTRAGACRLITEQVIDDCPEQYCFNGNDYNETNAKAEHTLEREKQLEDKRNKGDYKTVQEINSVKNILEDILNKKDKKDDINLSNNNNNNNIISNNINNN